MAITLISNFADSSTQDPLENLATDVKPLTEAAMLPDAAASPDLVSQGFGENPWIQTEQQRQKQNEEYQQTLKEWRINGMSQVDQAALDPAKYYAKDGVDSAAQLQLTNDAFLHYTSDDAPADPSPFGRHLARVRASHLYFNDRGADSEESFHAEVVKYSQDRKDSREMGSQLSRAASKDSFLADNDPKRGFSTWKDSAKNQPGYDPAKEADYYAAWHEIQSEVKDQVDAFRPELDSVWNAFTSKGDYAKAAGDAYFSLDERERDTFLAALKVRSGSLPDAEQATFWSNIVKQSGRDIKGFGTNMMNLVEVNAGVLGEASRDSRTGGMPDLYPSQMEAGMQRHEQNLKDSATTRERIDFQASVARIQQASYDPMKYLAKDGSLARIFEKGAYGAPGAIVTSASAAIPYVGMAAFYLSSQESIYQDYRQDFQDKGMSYKDAAKYAGELAPFAAVPQVLMEKLQIEAFAGRLPIFEKALTSVMDGVKSRALRFAVRTGAGTIEEGTLENLQDLVPAVIQDLGHALEQDIPDVQWTGKGGVLDGFWTKNAEMMVTMLPLAIFGAGVSAFKDSRIKAFSEASDTQLLAGGMHPDDVPVFREAVGKGVASANAALAAAAERSDANSDSAKGAVEDLMQQSVERKAAMERAQQSGWMPRIVQSADGYQVLDGESGQEIGQAPDKATAFRLASNHSAALSEQRAEKMSYIASMLEAGENLQALDPNSQNSFELGTLYTEAVAAAEDPRHIDQFQQQVADEEVLNGGTGNITRIALGQNKETLRGTVRSFTNRLFAGSSVLTLTHETGHGMLRQLRAAGEITHADELAFVRAVDNVMNAQVLRRGNQAGQRLALLNEGIADADVTPKMLDEAIQKIIEAELLRTRKRNVGDKSIPLANGIISRNMIALAKLAPGATQKFRAFLESLRGVMGLASARALAMKKAIREGKLNEADHQAFLDKLTGRDYQGEHDAAVQAELKALNDFVPTDNEPFSMGSLFKGSPTDLRDSLIDRIGEDALRLEQPKASYEDKRQLLLDFAQSILEGDSGKASGEKELDQEGDLRGRIGNASIIRQRLARDLETDLQVRFIGETIGSPEELAVKAQALRNPRFETFYLLAAKRRTKRHKGGAGYQILDAMAITARVPTSAAIFADGKNNADGLADHLAFLQAAKADSYFLMHNHPSGDPSPSSADLRVTLMHSAEMKKHGIQMVNHVVINHASFATIDDVGVVNGHAISPSALREAGAEVNPYAWPSRLIDGVNDIGQQALSADRIASISRDIESDRGNPDHIIGFITTARGAIAATFTGSAINILQLTREQISEYTLSQGGAWLMLHAKAASKLEAERLINNFHGMNRANLLTDIVVDYVDEKGRNWYASGMEMGLFSRTPTFYGLESDIVGERVQENGSSAFSLSPDYGINHRPSEEGPRAHDLAEGELMPADVYDHPEWYTGMGSKIVRETMAQLKKVRNNPEGLLKIFRAGPKAEMNQGDWVTLSKEYARTHAMGIDPDQNTKVWVSEVKAQEVRWAMDDLAEFGYFGESTTAEDSGTAFSLGNAPSNLYDSNHTDERRRDISRSTFPQSSLGQGAGGSPSGIRGEIARAKAEGSERTIGRGTESDVISFGENLVLKSIRAKGIWHYDPDGRLIRSTDLEDVRSKAEVINALGGMPTQAIESDGAHYLVQEYGTPITDAEYEALRLPFNIVPSQGLISRIEVNSEEYFVSDLNKDNFLKDKNGQIRVTDLVTGRVNPGASPLPEVNDSSFSLAPVSMVDGLSLNATARNRNPEVRRAIFQRMLDNLAKLRRDRDELGIAFGKGYKRSMIEDPRKTASIRKEAAFREATRRAELEDEAHAKNNGILDNADLAKLKSQPVHEYLGNPDSPLRGRLMSQSQAIARGETFFDPKKQGDYDGADGISRSVFGGTLAPDQAAQELFDNGLIKEPTADAMWQALERESNSVAKMKEYMKAARADVATARKVAKDEAKQWMKERMAKEASDYSPKNQLLRSLAMLDAMMMALPTELRGKIGGYTQLAKIGTDEKRLQFLNERLNKIDKVVESYLRERFDDEMEALLKRSRPNKAAAGEKPRGKITADIHSLFTEMERAMALDGDDAEAEAVKYEGKAANLDGKLSPDEEAHFLQLAQMIRLAGNWHHLDAAARAAAVAEATTLFENGYAEFKAKQRAKSERRQGQRDSLIQATGKDGTREEVRIQKDKELKLTGWIKKLGHSLQSFEALVHTVFGENSDIANYLADWERRASNAKEDAMEKLGGDIDDLLARLAGDSFKAEKLRKALADPQGISILDWKNRKSTFSQLEAITATLMWRQADGKRHMTGHLDDDGNPVGKWHYREQDIQEIESKLSPEALAIRLFIMDRYAGEWQRLNPIFRDLYGINLPKNENYAPITVDPLNAPGGQLIDAETGAVAQGTSMTPGSLRTRSQSAIAQPRLDDALQVFLGHSRQMEHWMAYAPLATEAMSLLNNREVGDSIKASSGEESVNMLRNWIDLFAQGGIRDKSTNLFLNRMIREATGRLSSLALVGRASVLMIQSTQLAAASLEMPGGAYLTRFTRLMMGDLGWRKAMASDYIQRRLGEQPPIVRQAMEGLNNRNPSKLKFAMQKVGKLINGADALFTAGTYAILYDYHLKLAETDLLLSGASAERYAQDAAARSTDRVAQPTRMGARSYYENSVTNPAAKLMWNFASDARQKIIYASLAASKGKTAAQKITPIALVWAMGGVLPTLLRSIWSDLRDDDDKEWFDERNWDPKRLALASLTSPFQGIPLLGDAISKGIWGAAGEYKSSGSLLDGIGNGFKATAHLDDILRGERDFDEVMQDLEGVLTLGAVVSGNAAAAGSAAHIVRDLVKVLKNIEGPN
jgi:hypothetical protein